jgi:hypothetical protein
VEGEMVEASASMVVEGGSILADMDCMDLSFVG